MKKAIVTIAACCALLAGCSHHQESSNTTEILVGTYGDAIHAYAFNPHDGSFVETAVIPAKDPSYIAFGDADSQGRRTLYAVDESGAESGITSFAEDADGNWVKTGYCDSIGTDPCFVRPVPGTPFIFTADYTGGVLSVFKTDDGAITERCQKFEYETAYPDGAPSKRQSSAHVHQVKVLPPSICQKAGIEGDWVLASDLGNDRIHILSLDKTKDEPLTDEGFIDCGPGAGPRHMEFNDNACMLYCVTELSGEVIAWNISSEDGKPSFTEAQRIVADEVNAAGSADIHISPDGTHLYTSHRLQNDGISIFSVSEDGTLTKTGYINTGIHPRNFAITEDGSTMLVACRDSKSVEVYDIDKSTGALTRRAGGLVTEKDAPVCILLP